VSRANEHTQHTARANRALGSNSGNDFPRFEIAPATQAASATPSIRLKVGKSVGAICAAIPYGRYLIENTFRRLKDFRRVHTRYDKLAANFLLGVALATAMTFWL